MLSETLKELDKIEALVKIMTKHLSPVLNLNLSKDVLTRMIEAAKEISTLNPTSGSNLLKL